MSLLVDHGQIGPLPFLPETGNSSRLCQHYPSPISSSVSTLDQSIASDSVRVPGLTRSTVHFKLQQSPLADRHLSVTSLLFPLVLALLSVFTPFGFGKSCHTLLFLLLLSLVTFAQAWPCTAPIDISSATTQGNLSLCLHVKYSRSLTESTCHSVAARLKANIQCALSKLLAIHHTLAGSPGSSRLKQQHLKIYFTSETIDCCNVQPGPP